MRPGDVDENDPYQTYDEAKLVTAVRTARDRCKPGRDAPIRYSNFGFAILGLALARRLGTSWDHALRDRVLVPAGLVETAPRPVNPRALRIDKDGNLSGLWELAAFAPAGGLWMSAADLGRWLTLLTEAVHDSDSDSDGDGDGGDRDGGQDSPERRHARQLVRTTLAPQARSISAHVGLAWHLFERDGVAWLLGASSFAGVDQRNGRAIGVFALGNHAGRVDRAALRALTGR